MGLVGSFILLIVSLVLIAVGAILTISIIFSFVGIPLLIFGVILLIVSIISLVFGTLGDVLSIFSLPFRHRKKKDPNVIDVKKKGGVYKAK